MQHLADLNPTASLPAVRVYRCVPCRMAVEETREGVAQPENGGYVNPQSPVCLLPTIQFLVAT
jgi:hypothetical protein